MTKTTTKADAIDAAADAFVKANPVKTATKKPESKVVTPKNFAELGKAIGKAADVVAKKAADKKVDKKAKTTKSKKELKTRAAATLNADALKYAQKLAKAEYGACTVIRATAQRFKSLTRGEMLLVADELKLNRGTTQRQFQEVRSGKTEIDLSTL